MKVFQVELSLTELVNWDRRVTRHLLKILYFISIQIIPLIIPIVGKKSYPLDGVWEVSEYKHRYTNGTIDDPKLPQTLEDFLKQKICFTIIWSM